MIDYAQIVPDIKQMVRSPFDAETAQKLQDMAIQVDAALMEGCRQHGGYFVLSALAVVVTTINKAITVAPESDRLGIALAVVAQLQACGLVVQ